jgi:hypothetical protein
MTVNYSSEFFQTADRVFQGLAEFAAHQAGDNPCDMVSTTRIGAAHG